MRTVENVARYALTKNEAAASLGVSVDTFERYIQHELFCIRVGRLRLFPPKELERWVAGHVERP